MPPPRPNAKPLPPAPRPRYAPPMTDERIAKVLARAGIASRREAERMIEGGRVSVNGRRIDSPALNVGPADRIEVDGKPIPDREPPRIWLYHKPLGLVTTERDEKGRTTVFDSLPDDMPRVMSVGRLDLNSEGLLLLTNDGEVKRRLELPTTGWTRKYRVRVHGAPSDDMLKPLRDGLTVEGERFRPMTVTIDRQQGANAWLTIAIREGRNREIRRALEAVGLSVNRLIRVSYGPFRLAELAAGAVSEVRQKIVRDQLGLPSDPASETGTASAKPRRVLARKPGKGRPRPSDGRDVLAEGRSEPKRGGPRNSPKPRPRSVDDTEEPRGARPSRSGPRRSADDTGATGPKARGGAPDESAPRSRPRRESGPAGRSGPPSGPGPRGPKAGGGPKAAAARRGPAPPPPGIARPAPVPADPGARAAPAARAAVDAGSATPARNDTAARGIDHWHAGTR